MSETQNAAPVLTESSERRIIAIPDAPKAEILRLHAELVKQAQAFDTQQQAFNEFIRVTRNTLGIRDNEFFEIAADASEFREVRFVEVTDAVKQAEPTEEATAQNAVTAGE